MRAAGRKRVGRQLQRALDEAIRRAVRTGHLEKRDEVIHRGAKEVVLWAPGAPSVSVRPRGQREFNEIPASEVAELMTRVEKMRQIRDEESRYRAVLNFYDTKRMTPNIRERLRRIDDERSQLLPSTQTRG